MFGAKPLQGEGLEADISCIHGRSLHTHLLYFVFLGLEGLCLKTGSFASPREFHHYFCFSIITLVGKE